MTRQRYRNYSYYFFLITGVFTWFLVRTLIYETGLKRMFFSALFGLVIFQVFRLALLMRRKARELDLR